MRNAQLQTTAIKWTHIRCLCVYTGVFGTHNYHIRLNVTYICNSLYTAFCSFLSQPVRQ